MRKRLKLYGICLLFFIFQLGFGQEYDKRLEALEDKAYEYFYSNKDSTYFYFDEINKLALSNNQIPTAIDNLNYVCFSAGYFYDLDKIKSTIEQTEELIKRYSNVLDTLPNKGSFQKNYLSFNKGIYYHKLEDYKKAEQFFDYLANEIILIPNYEDNIDDLDLVSNCYSYIAQMNALTKKYTIANDYYEKNIRLFKRFKSDDLEGLFKVYNLYANSLYEEGKLDKAKKLWLTSLDFNEKNYTERNRNSIVTTNLLLSNVYKDLNKLDSATFYLGKINKYKIKNDPFIDSYLVAQGEIHSKEGNYSKALLAFENALEASLDHNKPRLRKKIGDLYLKKADSESALLNYQQGIVELNSEFTSVALETNPDPSSIKQKNVLLSLLAAKASALSTLPEVSSKANVLNAVDAGLHTLDLLKPTFKNQTDKLRLVEDAFKLFETGIEIGYLLQEVKLENKYIDTVFKYSEKSKSVLLLEALLGAKATEFANIPDHLIERERQLKSEITHLEKQLNATSKTNIEKEEQLFKLKEDHRILITNIENNYQEYFNLKYNTKIFTLVETQKLLKSDEKLISYFYGTNAIYAIAVDNSSKQIHRITLDTSLENSIKEMRQMLADSKSDVTVLSTLSYKLYQDLISPLITSVEKKKLIIIPDGLLNYIPFGALNTDENGLSYLMEHHAIGYANSATLYAQLTDRKKKTGDLLAFAPTFSGEQVQVNPSRDELLPLPHNKREVEQILNSFNGQSYVNERASLENFTTQLSNYSMLHLATHAVFDDSEPEYSYLAFSSSEIKENLLYVSDLYNLQIDADLVTLSACESGVGELKRGEGFLSLARGFFYSGASSIASTLWKVNDASTASLMDSFYKNLSDGNSKDVALQMAQKDFLKTNNQNGLSHPYYWSGFIISGNTQALTTPNYLLWIGLGGLLLLIGGFFLFRKKAT